MKTTINLCAQKHIHRTFSSAQVCDVAWRCTMRKRLKTDELVEQLREVLALAARRRLRVVT